ncbi:MAG: gamma-glutamyl-gamma-aminobutyrate hydrolase family protein [Micromonosporaceae bacterium]
MMIEGKGRPSSPKPVIGISGYAERARWGTHWHKHATLVPHAYVDRVAASGCVPVVLPPVPGIEHTVGRLDGLLLSGGGDVDPARYAARKHPKTNRVNHDRDAAELALLDAAMAADLPVLGICRGLQVLNVFMNGTLHQHLPEMTGHDGHSPGPAEYGPQPVQVALGSRVAKILGREAVEVLCHHHQVIDKLGTGLTATAWSDDGTVEAVELADHPFAVGVQWHPEMSEDDSLFVALAEAARSR